MLRVCNNGSGGDEDNAYNDLGSGCSDGDGKVEDDGNSSNGVGDGSNSGKDDSSDRVTLIIPAAARRQRQAWRQRQPAWRQRGVKGGSSAAESEAAARRWQTDQPTSQLTDQPTARPSNRPTGQPKDQPTNQSTYPINNKLPND
jgi:hypothetical protein